MSKLFKK